jgi:branched-chain amino acid transport system ATP-binding protein
MLRIKNLEAGYGPLKVLRKVSMHIAPGEIVTVIGANGAGKTTLLKTISGLLCAQAGEIVFEKRNIRKLPPETIVFLGCSLVPEGRQLFAPMTVRENLILGAYVQYRRGRQEEVKEDLERVFTLFPLLKERETQLAGTLSGGEQQMLAIGRALMSGPNLILFDEISLGLAPLVIKHIYQQVKQINAEGITALLVEQDIQRSLKAAHKVYIMQSGRIRLEGRPQDLSQEDIRKAYFGL